MCPRRNKWGTNENTTVDETDAELFNILLWIKDGSISKVEMCTAY
jgi:hypothetical protein